MKRHSASINPSKRITKIYKPKEGIFIPKIQRSQIRGQVLGTHFSLGYQQKRMSQTSSSQEQHFTTTNFPTASKSSHKSYLKNSSNIRKHNFQFGGNLACQQNSQPVQSLNSTYYVEKDAVNEGRKAAQIRKERKENFTKTQFHIGSFKDMFKSYDSKAQSGGSFIERDPQELESGRKNLKVIKRAMMSANFSYGPSQQKARQVYSTSTATYKNVKDRFNNQRMAGLERGARNSRQIQIGSGLDKMDYVSMNIETQQKRLQSQSPSHKFQQMRERIKSLKPGTAGDIQTPDKSRAQSRLNDSRQDSARQSHISFSQNRDSRQEGLYKSITALHYNPSNISRASSTVSLQDGKNIQQTQKNHHFKLGFTNNRTSSVNQKDFRHHGGNYRRQEYRFGKDMHKTQFKMEQNGQPLQSTYKTTQVNNSKYMSAKSVPRRISANNSQLASHFKIEDGSNSHNNSLIDQSNTFMTESKARQVQLNYRFSLLQEKASSFILHNQDIKGQLSNSKNHTLSHKQIAVEKKAHHFTLGQKTGSIDITGTPSKLQVLSNQQHYMTQTQQSFSRNSFLQQQTSGTIEKKSRFQTHLGSPAPSNIPMGGAKHGYSITPQANNQRREGQLLKNLHRNKIPNLATAEQGSHYPSIHSTKKFSMDITPSSQGFNGGLKQNIYTPQFSNIHRKSSTMTEYQPGSGSASKGLFPANPIHGGSAHQEYSRLGAQISNRKYQERNHFNLGNQKQEYKTNHRQTYQWVAPKTGKLHLTQLANKVIN